MRPVSTNFIGILFATLGGCVPHIDAQPAYSLGESFIDATVVPGRADSCLINPPLTFIGSTISQGITGGAHVLRTKHRGVGTAILVAYGPSPDAGEETTAFVVDELTLWRGTIASSSGNAGKIFQYRKSISGIKLVPRRVDYSVCRVASTSLSSRALIIAQNWERSVARHAVFGMTFEGTPMAAASALNIFGIEPDSYVRLRLSSQPVGADVVIDGLKQPTKTNTVLDVRADGLLDMRLEKSGFEPCSFPQWKGHFDPGSRRVLNASCALKAKGGRTRRR